LGIPRHFKVLTVIDYAFFVTGGSLPWQVLEFRPERARVPGGVADQDPDHVAVLGKPGDPGDAVIRQEFERQPGAIEKPDKSQEGIVCLGLNRYAVIGRTTLQSLISHQ
jgi:hypothetical protein